MCQCLSNEYFDVHTNQCFKILTATDCERVSSKNVEMYWNDSYCVDAIAYNESCTNSSSSYMCRMLTEGTNCDGLTTKCICDSSKYFNYQNKKCENILSINGTCTQIDACNHVLGLICSTGLCQCDQKTQFWSRISLKCINYLSYNEGTCTADDQCTEDGLVCILSGISSCSCPSLVINGRCDCPTRVNGTEYFWNGFNCTPALPYNQGCANALTSYMCQIVTQGTICSGNPFVCKCPTTQYFNNTANQCENLLSIKQTCQQSDACNNVVGLNCNLEGYCQCNSSQFWNIDTQSCTNYFSYNEGSCTADDQCKGNNLICYKSGVSCNCPTNVTTGKCDCPPRRIGSEYYWNGVNCTDALNYNDFCENSTLLNYMCKTLTEGHFCRQ
jgi:hypothetical protein